MSVDVGAVESGSSVDTAIEEGQISDSSSHTNDQDKEELQEKESVEHVESTDLVSLKQKLDETSEAFKPKAPPPLNKEEEARLNIYEELFSHRFSEEDVLFAEVEKEENATPPVVENWYVRPKRSFDWTSQRRGGGGGGDRYRDGPSRAYYAGQRDSPQGSYHGGGGYQQHGGAGRGNYGGQRYQPYRERSGDQHGGRSHDWHGGRSSEQSRGRSHNHSHSSHRNQQHGHGQRSEGDGQNKPDYSRRDHR